MSRSLVGARGETHSLEALIHAAEAGEGSDTSGVKEKELKVAAVATEEGAPAALEPEEVIEPPEDPDNDNAEYGEMHHNHPGLCG